MAIMLICNPVKVWDFEDFFKSNPKTGYWVVPKTVFQEANSGDRLYLRVTSAHARPGIYGRFICTSKKTGTAPSDHWKPNAHPSGLQYQIIFEIEHYFPNYRISVDDLQSLGIKSSSRLLRVPQEKAASIGGDEADRMDELLRKRAILS